MRRYKDFLIERLSFLGMVIVLISSLAACGRGPSIDITSRSTISGVVNGSKVEGKILAHFNTARGGSSTCNFTQLPEGFNPGTFGTHT